MSKKIISITKEGVRESISGNAQALPSSAELRFDGAALVESVLDIAEATTGSVAGHSFVVLNGAGVVVLPANPTSGQKVTVYSMAPVQAGVSASHAHNLGPTLGIGVTAIQSGTTSNGFMREFLFHSSSLIGPRWWSVDGVGSGASGSYAF